MITSIADAYLDSTPLVAITASGHAALSLIGRGAFQETDVFGMTAPIVKHSYLVTEPEELPPYHQGSLLHRSLLRYVRGPCAD